jgi:hypothetical protein
MAGMTPMRCPAEVVATPHGVNYRISFKKISPMRCPDEIVAEVENR